MSILHLKWDYLFLVANMEKVPNFRGTFIRETNRVLNTKYEFKKRTLHIEILILSGFERLFLLSCAGNRIRIINRFFIMSFIFKFRMIRLLFSLVYFLFEIFDLFSVCDFNILFEVLMYLFEFET